MKRNALPPRDRTLSLAFLAAGVLVSGAACWSGLPAREWVAGLSLVGGAAAALNLWILRRPIFPYDCILSAHSTDGLDWRPEPGIRLDVGGRHRSTMVYHPALAQLGDEARMFYRAGAAAAVIACAGSRDGLAWTEMANPVFRNGGPYRHRRLDGASVLAHAGRWLIFYAAYDGQWWRIYRRSSVDLDTWEEELCCLDLSGVGPGCNAIDPSVVAGPEGLALYFLCCGNGQQGIWRTVSRDGLVWEAPVACAGYQTPGMVPRDPCVVREDGVAWRMYFSEHPAGSAVGSRIVSAVSADGVHWQREPGVRLAPAGPDGVHGVFCPSVRRVAGGWRMYYGAYWGRHWLEPFTLRAHRPASAA